MKILYITQHFPPRIGGIETTSYHLFTHLKRNIDVSLVAWTKIKPRVRIPFFIRPIIIIILLFRSVLRIIQFRPQIIHLSGGSLFFLGLLLMTLKIPITVTLHGLDIIYERFFLYQPLLRIFFTKVNRIICVSKSAADECQKRLSTPKKITIIPNGINPVYSKLKARNRRSPLPKDLQTALTDKYIILSVGRLEKRKGFHWFIQNVFPKVKKLNSSTGYILVGEGTYRKTIEETINSLPQLKKHIFLLGHVSDEVLRRLYHVADLFVMPNIPVKGDIEGFGIVLLEASASGLCVVASNIEGIRDAITNGKNGFLIEPHDDEEFAARILHLLANKGERQRFGNQAKQYTLNKFNWKKVAEKYIDVFQEIVEGHNGRIKIYKNPNKKFLNK